MNSRTAQEAWVGGFAANLIIGAVAGFRSIVSDGRTSPAQALCAV